MVEIAARCLRLLNGEDDAASGKEVTLLARVGVVTNFNSISTPFLMKATIRRLSAYGLLPPR